MEKAMFGAGCFWSVEETFLRVPGVVSTAVGYSGGTTESPTYRQVCSGTTGHAEVCQVEFDPETVSFEQLLETFWNCHDPTTLNRQGPDVGEQYRSAIYYYSESQKGAAESSLQQLQESGRLPRKIVTEITPASAFYPAEEYHQQYIRKNGGGHCAI